ncbi:bifunctional 4-hydroxy-2-oxoglutarate aldolase/2-dehydro-3-deoxy-phosphogluconate aldolase [Tamlana agarivorans]|uniref:Bifunctional 4-hydroxy-2-oxoglutarate aldolase/2-dehydro-3-deoxy-phosphogluconate aldolase n=1 Tax=Pseudotamlana agarivorans TaxID=481183 RepID=A0ACC5U9H5_9FLAO|nr:bifunctional 4-hydroxy-2-oxoglutarate aldolase/2-dehydro-3-deoxy-phosphogluconate aldolase [Tamlana agarivorans]MBU2950982.1 bifunctional 4-hydroxy-2-oxoglutarate aldolase/2-dehydro-3-deoxy-phosphogluconate aldolase [Tamlana agarivorans]
MQPIAQQAMPVEMIKKIDDSGVIAVLVIDELKHAVPLANALLKGGVDSIELTLRTPVAIDAAKAIKKQVPEITLGFGTVLTTDQVKAVVDLGADFAVAPGCNPKVIAEARKQGLPFAPGIMTPTDIEMALEEGCRILKYFPAETSGGMENLKSMVAPYQYLGLKFIPLGGLNINNASTYLESSLITAIGGSWIAKSDLIHAENWDEITKNAQEIRDLITSIRSK